MDIAKNSNDERLVREVLRLNGRILGLVFGLLCGLAIFLATNWLVLRGGNRVGPHLSLLNNFFVGYSVSFTGSLVGMAYGFGAGYLAGLFVAWTYNRVVAFRDH
ncbi:MAG: hypothetical protein HYX74_05355 [Acidobacteria bacterium]|nr:hypothetical protein [Acidobacteriota bacterium]